MFKFLEKRNDEIQEDVNMAVDESVCAIKDQIDAMVTEEAYGRVADIMENQRLGDDDEIHDELFQEVFDSIYNELGLY